MRRSCGAISRGPGNHLRTGWPSDSTWMAGKKDQEESAGGTVMTGPSFPGFLPYISDKHSKWKIRAPSFQHFFSSIMTTALWRTSTASRSPAPTWGLVTVRPTTSMPSIAMRKPNSLPGEFPPASFSFPNTWPSCRRAIMCWPSRSMTATPLPATSPQQHTWRQASQPNRHPQYPYPPGCPILPPRKATFPSSSSIPTDSKYLMSPK